MPKKKKKALETTISEHQSEAIKNITLLYTLYLVFVHTLTNDASNKLNKNVSVNSCFKLHIPILNLKVK